jgi:hypothetical protein
MSQPVSSKSLCSPICSQTNESIGFSINRRYHDSPIHLLNNDVLLNIFYFYRLENPEECEDERWWYRLAHICRRWRNLILESPSRLDLHLNCTNGVPVADMLAHSPPLPLIIHYHKNREITAEDESGLLLALSHRDRVRRIDLWGPPNVVGKSVRVMDDKFPILEQMNIYSWTQVAVDLPMTFQAPNLRHLTLSRASLPIGSSLLTTSITRLVTLELKDVTISAYFPPSYIHSRLMLMLQLEKLSIDFESLIPNVGVEWQSRQTPDMTTLPNLRQFFFRGTVRYLEHLVSRISAPSLSILRVGTFDRLTIPLPCFLQFMQTSENLTFTAVQVTFGEFDVSIYGVPRKASFLLFKNLCGFLDWQVVSAAQFFGTLSPILSVVEQVTFRYEAHLRPWSLHDCIDRRQWRELLRPLTNVKAIRVQDELDDLFSEIFSSLPSRDGEPPLELLPNLEEVEYSGGSDIQETFTRFLNERQVAGHPVSLRLVDRSMLDEPPAPSLNV